MNRDPNKVKFMNSITLLSRGLLVSFLNFECSEIVELVYVTSRHLWCHCLFFVIQHFLRIEKGYGNRTRISESIGEHVPSSQGAGTLSGTSISRKKITNGIMKNNPQEQWENERKPYIYLTDM